MKLFRRRRSPDAAPTPLAAWPCPHCGQHIPLTDHTIVVVFDRTEVDAHLLTHPGMEDT